MLFTDTEQSGVKICGITSAEQSQAIVNLGADAIGVNFWPKSKRYIALEDALPWLKDIEGECQRVAVFVNPSEEELDRVLQSGGIDWLQLHGDESEETVHNYLNKGWPVFKALGVKDESMLQAAERYSGATLLLDAYAPVEYGGTGETMDWQLGARAVTDWPDREIILAGGLHPGNVGDAVKSVNPAAVDVASGVEESPGVKDLAKVAEFINAAKNAE